MNEKTLYFAYGSNLNLDQMARYYWNTVLEGCRQNGIPMQPMLEAWREAAQACRPQKHRDTFESPDR